MASAVAWAYIGDLGVEHPTESRGRYSGQGDRGRNSPKAESLLVFKRPMEAANLPTFVKFGNSKKSDICVIFAKNHGWPRNCEGAGAKLAGGCVPGPSLKPPLRLIFYPFELKADLPVTSACLRNGQSMLVFVRLIVFEFRSPYWQTDGWTGKKRSDCPAYQDGRLT